MKRLAFCLVVLLLLSGVIIAETANLIPNGDFNEGLAGWTVQFQAGGVGEIVVDDGVATAIIDNCGTEQYSAEFFNLFPIEEGNIYEVTFVATAEEERSIAVLIQMNDNPWTAYLEEIIEITTDPKEYKLTWTADVTDSKSRLNFQFGLFDADVTLQDIQVIVVE